MDTLRSLSKCHSDQTPSCTPLALGQALDGDPLFQTVELPFRDAGHGWFLQNPVKDNIDAF
jgi:hypothetical protein